MSNYSFTFAKKLLEKNNISNLLSDKIFQDNLIKMGFARYFLGANVKSPKFSDDERKKMGLTLKEMLISCTFNTEICNN